MAFPSLFTTAALALLLALLYKYLVYPCFLSPLAKIPNAHWTSAVSARWIEGKRAAGTEVLTIYDLHQKHGSVVRLGPNELTVNSIQGLKTIYTGAFEKHSWYSDFFINFHTDNLVGMTHNQPHARQKRMLSKIYSKSYVQESTDLNAISRLIIFERLLPLLHGMARSGATINVLPLFQAVGMDFTSAYLFGTKHGTTYVSQPEEWAHWLDEYENFKYLSRKDRYGGFIETWCLHLCDKMQRKETANCVSAGTNAVVYNQLYSSLVKSPDDRPLRMAVASELLDHLVAGHETTGITVTYIMWELSRQLEVQKQLRQELSSLSQCLEYSEDGEEKSRLPSGLPSAMSIDSLPLLDAIVRETLRLHAPAPAPLPRVTPMSATGTTIDGYQGIPGGVRVSSSAYSLHRIPEVYPQPFEWLPERWLKPSPGKIHDMRRLFWPFGSGGRMCLGSNFALQEIKLVIAAVYANYTTSIVDDEGIEQDHAFISLPKGRKLMLKLRKVEDD
ncbi:cytochrome P450 [Aspergillus floccosus]